MHAPVCPPVRYTCVYSDADGLWSQYREKTPESGPELQRSDPNQFKACPEIYQNLQGTSRQLQDYYANAGHRPYNCSSYCYPDKHGSSAGWEIQRCLEDDHATYVGGCSNEDKSFRRLDRKLPGVLSLKQFNKQYHPKQKIKFLSVKERKQRLHEQLKTKGSTDPLDKMIQREEFTSILSEIKESHRHMFKKDYDVNSPDLLSNLLYDQFLMLNLVVDSPHAKKTGEALSQDLYGDQKTKEKKDYLFPERELAESYKPAVMSHYFKAIMDFGRNMQWNAHHKRQLTIEDMDDFHHTIVTAHRTAMKKHFDHDSWVRSKKGESRAIGRIARVLAEKSFSQRGRKLTDTKYTEPPFKAASMNGKSVGVFGKSCELLCPDFDTCVEGSEFLKCPQPTNIIGWMLLPVYYMVSFEQNFNLRYLIDQANVCWGQYDKNPSIDPLSASGGESGSELSNFEIAFYYEYDSLSSRDKTRFDNLLFCPPIFRRWWLIEPITWSLNEYVIENCGEDVTSRCVCSMFQDSAKAVDFDTMVFNFLPTFTWTMIQNGYTYINIALGSAFNNSLNPFWKGFCDIFHLGQFDTLRWLYNIFDYDYAVNYQAPATVTLCATLYSGHLFFFVFVILFPLMELIRNGLFKVISIILFEFTYYFLLYPVRNGLTFMDALQAYSLGISESKLRSFRTLDARGQFDQVSEIVSRQTNGVGKALYQNIISDGSETPGGKLTRQPLKILQPIWKPFVGLYKNNNKKRRDKVY